MVLPSSPSRAFKIRVLLATVRSSDKIAAREYTARTRLLMDLKQIRIFMSERVALASAFGLTFARSSITYVNSVGMMAQAMVTARLHVKGLSTIDIRFVTEDAPFGLHPLVKLGRRPAVSPVPAPAWRWLVLGALRTRCR